MKDIKSFLFDDYVQEWKNDGYDIFDARIHHLKSYSENYNRSIITTGCYKCLRWTYTLLSPFLMNNRKIIFQNELIKYTSIINKASKRNSIILGIKKSFLWDFLSRKTIFYPVFDNFYKNLNLGIINEDEEQINSSIEKLRETFEKLNPDVIVLHNDAFPDSRAIIVVSNEMSIPTVEIQHSIYQSNSSIRTGKYVDYIFVWGEYFKKLYLNKGIKTGKTIKILGYPYEIENRMSENREKKVVYYLGQNFEVYYEHLLDLKISTLNELNLLCHSVGFDFIYRPHPGDDVDLLKSKMSTVRFSPKNEELGMSFNKGDIFISFNSTTLIEAALRSKLCVQLKNYPLETDDFEELGICPSFDDLEDIGTYLKGVSNLKDYSSICCNRVDSDYIEIPEPDPGTRFLELLDDII